MLHRNVGRLELRNVKTCDVNEVMEWKEIMLVWLSWSKLDCLPHYGSNLLSIKQNNVFFVKD